MKDEFTKILSEIDLEIDEIDLYGYDIIETSLSMVHRLQKIVNDLRIKLQDYVFPFIFSKNKNPSYWDDCCFSIKYIV